MPRSRLAFDELFLLHTAMLQRRRQWQSQPPCRSTWTMRGCKLSRLPPFVHRAQRRAIEDIRRI